MNTKRRLQSDLKDALRARDERRKSVIRMALAALGHAEVEQRDNLDDAAAATVLRKQVRQRRDTIDELREVNRPELLANEEAELAILRVLWKRGPSTVREVQQELARDRRTGYTTALKLLQIMMDKGLVIREESRRPHVYQARFAEEQTQRQLVRDLLERAFGGSARKLVMQALTAKRASADELAEIRRLLDELEEGKK